MGTVWRINIHDIILQYYNMLSVVAAAVTTSSPFGSSNTFSMQSKHSKPIDSMCTVWEGKKCRKMPCRKNKATNHINITTYQFAFLRSWICFIFFCLLAYLLFFHFAIWWWWWWFDCVPAQCIFFYSFFFLHLPNGKKHQAWLAYNVNINKVVNVVNLCTPVKDEQPLKEREKTKKRTGALAPIA